MKISLELRDARNLVSFLNRTNIQGNEAITFIKLLANIQQQIDIVEKMAKIEALKPKKEEEKKEKNT